MGSERRRVNVKALERIGRELLVVLGEDPKREGLRETPARWARWWAEFMLFDGGRTEVTFDSLATDQMVVVSGMRVWSLCEHHLLPFSCDVSIGYIATKRVLGLSKFGRIAHQAAHRPQTQEALVHAIADRVAAVTGTPDVAVLAHGQHLCMTMRGIKTPATMSTSVMRGAFRASGDARAEFLSMAHRTPRT